MLARLEKCQIPAGRGRLMLDLSKAEIEVWQACNVKREDPVSKLLLSQEEQQKREVEARHKAVRLCEQCIATAKRIDEVDLVEESAIVMWNLGRELACSAHRYRIHKAFQKCAEVLDEVQSLSLVQLRVHLHFEIACCEIAQDLLTKGRSELNRALAIDYTVPQNELSEAVQKQIGDDDPAPYVRKLDASINQQRHLLHWKLNLYEEPTDVADQVMLLLDQVQRQSASAGKLTFNLLTQGYAKLEAALEELTGERLQALTDTFEPPPRVITSEKPLQPLPHQAPATVKEGGSRADEVAALVPQPIKDQKPKSKFEEGVMKLKRVVMLMCKIGLEANKVNEHEFAIRACSRAIDVADVSFGPPPIEVEGALLLAEAAYTKAQCLGKQLELLGVVNGIDDEIEDEVAEDTKNVQTDDANSESDREEIKELTLEEKAAAVAKKRELIKSLLFGMSKSHEFRQWWMVSNGLACWWNLHLELVSLSHERPQLLCRTLQEYQEGLRTMQKYLSGDDALPKSEFDHRIAVSIAMANINVSVEMGQLNVLDTDQLMVLKRLAELQRKDLMARVTELCKKKEKALPDLARLRPERLEAGAAPAAAGGKKGAPAAPPPGAGGEDKSDLQGNEADIVMATVSIPFSKDSVEAVKLVDQAVGFLNRWEPKSNDETMLTLWVELWTRLGRRCLGKPMNSNEGAKYALMCAIKGLEKVDAPIPKYASQDRLHWRGACHALCGEVFMQLVDPQKQEKESIIKLRRMSVEQFERCCEYATTTMNTSLAAFGATNLWNVALPLMHSAETRQILIGPFTKATRALAAVKYQEDPFFFAGLYRALFDCYADTGQWDSIHEMLSEAFPVIPASCQRRLWALRMLALSAQGKNVVVAMGKMKESQAKAQANIWLVLAGASSKPVDQLSAFVKAIEILQNAEQPDVVEVRLQFADWLLRNHFHTADAREQLAAAADMLLEIEEDSEDEEEDVGDDLYRGGFDGGESSCVSDEQSQSDGKSFTGQSRTSRRSSRMAPSDAGTRKSKSRGHGKRSSGRSVSRASSARSSRSSARQRSVTGRSTSGRSRTSKRSGSVKSKLSKQKKAEEDDVLSSQLYSHNYEALCRIFATQGRLAMGVDAHSALCSAAHFAIRFFASTVELANTAAQKLAVSQVSPQTMLTPGDTVGAGGSASPASGAMKRASTKSMGTASSLGGKKKEDHDAIHLMPSFAVPMLLSDWAREDAWPWVTSPHLPEVLKLAEQNDLLEGDSCTWAGHPEAFSRPSLSFHTLMRLEADLEDQGYHLLAFPVLALHLQLAQSFQAPLGDAVACLAHLRLSRFAAECRLSGAAEIATARWTESLRSIPDSFSSFDEEREQVRSQRAGRGNTRDLEPDWLELPRNQQVPSKQACAPWSCGELHAYEVWAAISKECILHGEVWMAHALADEAIKHAADYGDRRTMRELCITKARLARAEGQPGEVIKNLKDIKAADGEQAAQIGCLLADAYRQKGQSVLADAVLRDTCSAVQMASPASQGQHGSAREIQAECALRAEKVRVELNRLRLALVATQDWLSDLHSTFVTHSEIGQELHGAALYRCRVTSCIHFVKDVVGLLEAKRTDLIRDPANSGALTFDQFVRFAGNLVETIFECRSSRDALLAHTVPNEGVASGVVLPVEVLAAHLDVWEARCMAMRRELRVAAKEDRKLAAVRERCRTEHPQQGPFTSEKTIGGSRSIGPVKQLDEATALAQNVEVWLRDSDDKINETEQQKTVAREMSEVEASVALVSNAATVLQSGDFGAAGAGEEDAAIVDGQVGAPLAAAPFCRAEALAELGRLQLEFAAQQRPTPAASVWEAPTQDPYELRGMEVGERYSNVLANRGPQQLAEAPAKEAAEGGPEGGAEDSIQFSFEELAKATLCEALQDALAARNFRAARRALQALALEAYGLRCPEAAFEFLAWLQSVEVCARAEEVVEELLPEGHSERVHMHLLHELEARWPLPQSRSSYKAIKKRLLLESPTFQRMQLGDLPPIAEILQSSLPSLTLVVTLQVHNNYLYVGAVCTPPDGDSAQRLTQLEHMVTRIPVREAELNACLHKLQELNVSIEKEMITSRQVDEALAEQVGTLLAQAEATLIQPVVQDLVCHFWQYGLNIEHPCNPKQILLLPDSFLWGLPLERFPSLVALLPAPNLASIARDFSLHTLAQRSRTPPPIPQPASSVLLTDAFNEDKVEADEDPKSETMCAVHRRLIEAKVISKEEKSLHGQMLTASPEDVKGMLTDSTMFFALGFGRFFTTISSNHIAAQDLRHLKLVALFHRVQNDNAFRRQTKAESMKSLRQLTMENAYGTPLIATFRGVHCTVLSIAPVPVALSMRSFETFAKAIQAGKSAAKALEDVMGLQEKPEFRYSRTLEGGLPPGTTGPVDPKKPPPPPSPEGMEDLLPSHTRTAYMAVGLAWVPSEAAEGDGKKKK